jgi:hypothetical protein
MIPLNRTFVLCPLLAAGAASLLVWSPAGAQDIAACRSIAADAERLACFDRASQNPPTPIPPPAAAPAAPATSYNPFAFFGLSTPASNKPEDFGRSSMPPGSNPVTPAPDGPPALTRITAKITQIIDPQGKAKFVLDNNQIWTAVNYLNIKLPTKGTNTATILSYPVGYQMRLNDSTVEFAVKRLK